MTTKQTVKCKCGTKYRVSAELAGKKAKCKKCGLQFVIPIHKRPSAANDEIASVVFAAALLNSNSAIVPTPNNAASNAADVQPANTVRPCPKCNRTLGKGKVVCIYCGYHTGRSKQLTPVSGLSATDKSTTVITNCPECNRAWGKGKSTCMYCGYNVDSGKKISMDPVGYGDGSNYGIRSGGFGSCDSCSSCSGGCGGGCGSGCGGGCGGCGG